MPWEFEDKRVHSEQITSWNAFEILNNSTENYLQSGWRSFPWLWTVRTQSLSLDLPNVSARPWSRGKCLRPALEGNGTQEKNEITCKFGFERRGRKLLSDERNGWGAVQPTVRPWEHKVAKTYLKNTRVRWIFQPVRDASTSRASSKELHQLSIFDGHTSSSHEPEKGRETKCRWELVQIPIQGVRVFLTFHFP